MQNKSAGKDIEDDGDLIFDLDLVAAGDGDEDILAALDKLAVSSSDGPAVPDTVASVEPEWLVDVRELVRRHGPFSPAHVMKIIPILTAGFQSSVDSSSTT